MVSISPDLPPVLRPLKSELLQKRRQLPAAQKARSSVRYLRAWPYVQLRVEGRPPVDPDTSFNGVLGKVLGVPARLECPEPTDST